MNALPPQPAGARATRAEKAEGFGITFSRYKNMAAYSAVAVSVTVDEQVRLDRVWSATSAGLVIKPDGANNQLEVGILHVASFALKEQVRIGGDGIRSRDWNAYPILRFSGVPPVEVELIAAEYPGLGVGEATIGNAVAYAFGRRLYDMPLTRQRIVAALLV